METSELFIPVVLGTAREGRESEKVARYVVGEVEKSGVQTELIDVRDHAISATIPSWVEDERAQPWRDIVAKADGFVLVVPEYNRGIPGELKLLLDREMAGYRAKPVGLVGVSGGFTGGSRMMQGLKSQLIPFELVPMQREVYFGNVQDLFDDDGVITDTANEEMVAGQMEQVVWYAKALKAARDGAAV